MPRVELSIRLPEEMVANVDDLAKQHGSTRSDVIGQLLTDALSIREEYEKGGNIIVWDGKRDSVPNKLVFNPFHPRRGDNVIDFPKPI